MTTTRRGALRLAPAEGMDESPTARRLRVALVTGATGFIGRHLVEALLSDGVHVRGLARSEAGAASVVRAGAECCRGDVTQPETLARAVEGVDTVFHLAALVGPAAAPMRQFEEVNVEGTRNLLDAIRRHGCAERVVHVSTVAVTENAGPGHTVTEECEPAPTGRYGRTKWAAEELMRRASRDGISVVVARPVWVYGVRSPGAVKLFRLIARRRMVLVGGGHNLIQPVAVDDLVRGLMLAAISERADGRVYQFAGGTAMTTKQFCGEIARAVGAPPPSLHVPMPIARAAAVACEWCYPLSWGKPPIDRQKIAMFRTDHRYSIQRAERDLGWTPAIGLREGLARTAADMRQQGLLR